MHGRRRVGERGGEWLGGRYASRNCYLIFLICHFLISAWWPDLRMSGTLCPIKLDGRVYCGYSFFLFNAFEKLSSSEDSSSPRTPGSSRESTSTSTIAGSSPPVRTYLPIESSMSTKLSRILWSMPSYLPHSRMSPACGLPGLSLRASFWRDLLSFSAKRWVSILPSGLRNTTGPRLNLRTWNIASYIGWGVMSIPGPPPNGLSSTFLCLFSENLRMSWVYMSTRRSLRARLIMLSFRYESKISGKIVRMSKRIEILFIGHNYKINLHYLILKFLGVDSFGWLL